MKLFHMKKHFRFFSVILILGLLLGMAAVPSYGYVIGSSYSNASNDEPWLHARNYYNDIINVVLLREYSLLDFGEIEALFDGMGISQVTFIDGVSVEAARAMTPEQNFHRSLYLTLAEPGRDNLLVALAKVKRSGYALNATTCGFDISTSTYEYALDRVFVQLLPQYCGIDDQALRSIFDGMGFTKVKDLTAGLHEKIGDDFYFMRQVELTLETPGEASLSSAIAKLNKLEQVAGASKSYGIDYLPRFTPQFLPNHEQPDPDPGTGPVTEKDCSDIWVVLKHEYSDVDAETLRSMFEGMGFKGMFDFGADMLEVSGYSDNFVRFLILYLEEPGIDSANEAVKKLDQLEYVLMTSKSDLQDQFRNICVRLNADAASDIEGDVEYTVSLSFSKGLLNLDLEFEIDSSMLAFTRIEGLSGYEASGGVLWQNIGDGIWRGQVTLVNTQEASDHNFMSMLDIFDLDVAKFVYSPRSTGNATMKLTGVNAFGYDVYWDWVPVNRGALIVKKAATTAIQQLNFSKYDLNKDNTTDNLDLGIMLIYCGSNSSSADWDDLAKVTDSRHNDVTASMCDVNGDGIIDMLDLLDLFIHYTK